MCGLCPHMYAWALPKHKIINNEMINCQKYSGDARNDYCDWYISRKTYVV